MARGNILRRGDSWRIAVELEPDPLTDKRRQKYETVHGSRKDAEKRLTELLAQLDQQSLGASARMTLGQFLDRWLVDHAASLAPKTYARYCQIVRNQVKPYVGNVRLDRVTPSHAVRLLAILRDADRLDGRGKLSTQSLMHVFRMLHTALESARKWRLIGRNPLDDVDPPKVQRGEMKTFTVEQTIAFLRSSAEEGVKWEAFFTVAIMCGLRLGELKGLRWQDVDLDAGTLRIQQSIQRVEGIGIVTRQPKTANGRRPVALGAETIALLRHNRAEQNAERLSMGPLWHDSGLVFPSQVGTALENKRIREVFHRICDRAGVPRIRPYDLRHSCASLLLAAGVNPKIVSERLGHSSVTLTLGTYSHVLPMLQQDAANTLERLLTRE